MCFIQLLDETFNLEIEGTMNEEIHENVNLPLEIEDEFEMPPQLTYVAYGIHNLQNENSRNRIDDAYFQTILDDEELLNEENLQASNQSCFFNNTDKLL